MEIYISTDIESDGPIPGPHSMLSFASAAFTVDRAARRWAQVGTFSRNLAALPGAAGDPETMAWWGKNQAAFDATRAGQAQPAEAMAAYLEWLERMEGAVPGERAQCVFVGYPVAFDFLFVYWYLIRFAGRSPFSHSALDMKTLAMARLGTEYREVSKRTMPGRWFGKARHTHVALDDAIEQGELFCAMLLDEGPAAR